MEAPLISLVSFGYKYGAPAGVNLLVDLRFLRNPYHVEELRSFTGLDPRIQDFVLANPEGERCLSELLQFIGYLARGHAAKGTDTLSVALGCTGGHHRSVSVTEALARLLGERGLRVEHCHRDIEKEHH